MASRPAAENSVGNAFQMVSCTIVNMRRPYLHISYLASTWSPDLDKELAELAVQSSVLEQNAGRKEEMGRAGCCKVTPRSINHVISKVKGRLTRHCE